MKTSFLPYIGDLKDEVWCDVVPLEVCFLFLWHPLHFVCDPSWRRRFNIYFVLNNRKFNVLPQPWDAGPSPSACLTLAEMEHELKMLTIAMQWSPQASLRLLLRILWSPRTVRPFMGSLQMSSQRTFHPAPTNLVGLASIWPSLRCFYSQPSTLSDAT